MKKISLVALLTVYTLMMNAQEKLAVLNFDVLGKSLTKQQLISITRTEIAKAGIYQVLDQYTVQEAYEGGTLDLEKCYGTNCLSTMGQKLKVKYVVAGTTEIIGDKAMITLRMIDVTKQEVVKTSYSEFLWSEENAPRLLNLSVLKLLDQPIDPKLLSVYDYNTVKQGNFEGPKVKKFNLSGPRFGGVYQTDKMGDILAASKNEGGFNKSRFMTSIGYQFEKQYLYTGPFQAVFQANLSLNGLDQQMAIPSLAVLNGFRGTKNGWEFGFGPIFRVRKMAEGFYRADGSWHLNKEQTLGEVINKEDRLDSRGENKLISSWVWAVGKSFKAGNMNIPINAYAIPDKDGWMFGLSMGYALSRK